HDIRLGNDARATARIVHNRDTPDLMFLHRRNHLVQRSISAHGHDRSRHAGLDGVAGWILPLSNDSTDDIAIGHDTDGPIGGIDDWDLAAAVLYHHLGDLIDRGPYRTARRVWRHDVAGELGHMSPPIHLPASKRNSWLQPLIH